MSEAILFLTHAPTSAILWQFSLFPLFIPEINIAKNTEKMKKEKGKIKVGAWVKITYDVIVNKHLKVP